MATISSALTMFGDKDGLLVPKAVLVDTSKIIDSNQQNLHATQEMDKNYLLMNNTIGEQNTLLKLTNDALYLAAENQQKMNDEMEQGKKKAEGLWTKLKGIVNAKSLTKGLKDAFRASDTFMSMQMRLGLIVDEGQTPDQLSDKIFAASIRARGDYAAMAANASNLGMLAGDTFSGTDEIVAFTELMQKAFKLGGAAAAEQQAGMDKIIEAMAAGKLQGADFLTIMAKAPMLADAIAAFTGKSMDELKAMAAEGAITADMIKAALFTAADAINNKFGALPTTFGEVWQQFKDVAFKAFEPVFQRLNEWLNSPLGTAIVQLLTYAIVGAAQAVDWLLNVIDSVITAVQTGWGIIEPILAVIGSALAFWALTQIPMLTQQLWNMVKPILTQAAAWLSASWPILLIGALIGLLIYGLYRWGDVTAEIIGFVGGLFGFLFATIYNLVALIYNAFSRFAEFLSNVFDHPVYSIKKLFVDLLDSILQIIKKIAWAIDKLLGTNMANTISGFQDDLQDWLGAAPDGYKTTDRMEMMDFGEAIRTGHEMGKDLGKSASDGIQNLVDSMKDKLGLHHLFGDDLSDQLLKDQFGMSGLPGEDLTDKDHIDSINKVNEVGKIRDTVDISSEDLKIMRELAEMRHIQNFVTLTPTVQVTTGPVSKEVDVDTMIAHIETFLTEQIASSAQGVYG